MKTESSRTKSNSAADGGCDRCNLFSASQEIIEMFHLQIEGIHSFRLHGFDEFSLVCVLRADNLTTPSHMSNYSWKLLVSDLIKKSVMKTTMTQNEPLACIRIIRWTNFHPQAREINYIFHRITLVYEKILFIIYFYM